MGILAKTNDKPLLGYASLTQPTNQAVGWVSHEVA